MRCAIRRDRTSVPLPYSVKKAEVLALVNVALLRTLNPEKVTVGFEYTGEAEMDEM